MATETMVEPRAADPARACHVIDHRGSARIRFDRENAERLLDEGHFFWLDLYRPEPDDFEILRELFHYHPLAVEDSVHFHQRPKLDEYDDFVLLVVYGASPDEDRLVEVHCFYSERCLVTVHRDDCPAFREIRDRYEKRQKPIEKPTLLLYRIVDGLVDSFFPVLAELDDRIDDLEEALFARANEAQLHEIFHMKRLLVGMRKAITPQRDLFATLQAGAAALPGMTTDGERYFRDVYDHMIRISDLVDTYRDLLTGAMDVYLSTVSNRLNNVMKQLAIIATIFLPLTFITGFFGQNFGFMVRHISSWHSFVVFGVVLELGTIAAFLVMFKRRGWF